MHKKRDYQLTRYTKKEYNKAREGFKRYVHQYFINNNINGKFNKNITVIVLNTLTPSSNFFYNNYGVKYFITLNKLIPIKTAKNIVIFINNNAFVHSLISNIKPSNIELSGTEPNTVKSNNKGKSTTYFYNNNNNNINIKNFTVNINFLNCHFNDNR